MHLTFRLASQTDLAHCDWDVLDGFQNAPHLRSAVPKVWSRFLRDGGLTMMIVEDQEQPPQTRIVWHAASLFVPPDILERERQCSKPGIAARIVEAALAGDMPALHSQQVRHANRHGSLCLLGLHYALSPILDAQSARLVRAKGIEAYHAAFEGYWLQEILIEAYGEERRRVMEAGGFRLRTDYGDGTGLRAPYLMGITRTEAQVDEGSVIASLFTYTPPRFGFKPGEQEMLCRALLGETDTELASELCVSSGAIKTRWRMVYDRVQTVASTLLPDSAPQDKPQRGLEKRRHLLAYLRHHPEELRPCLAEISLHATNKG